MSYCVVKPYCRRSKLYIKRNGKLTTNYTYAQKYKDKEYAEKKAKEFGGMVL